MSNSNERSLLGLNEGYDVVETVLDKEWLLRLLLQK